MRKLNLGFVLLLAALAISCSCIKENCPCGRKGEAVFNGRDLSNWTAVSSKPEVKMEDVWSVRDGIIVCKGDPIGYIATAKTYQNFKLNAEYRWAPGATPGNSGLFLRINGQPRALPRCVECQLKNGNAGDLYGFHGMQINGEAARRKEVKGHELGGDFVGVTRIDGERETRRGVEQGGDRRRGRECDGVDEREEGQRGIRCGADCRADWAAVRRRRSAFPQGVCETIALNERVQKG